MTTQTAQHVMSIIVWASDITKIQESFGKFYVSPPSNWAGQGNRIQPYSLKFEGSVEEITKEEAEQRLHDGLPYAFSFVAQGPKSPGMGVAAGRSVNAKSRIDGGLVFVSPETGAVTTNESTYYVRENWKPLQELPRSLDYYKVEGTFTKAE